MGSDNDKTEVQVAYSTPVDASPPEPSTELLDPLDPRIYDPQLQNNAALLPGPPEAWTRTGVAYRERLARILNDITAMDTVCGHVANGGSVVTLCGVWNVRYSDVMRWIREDKDRSERYDNALEDRKDWSKELILRELRRIASSDMRKIFAKDGSLLPVDQWPEDMARAVQSVEVDELFEGVGREREQVGVTKKIKFWDKIKALELAGKNLAIFTDKIEHGASTLDAIIAGMGGGRGAPQEKQIAPAIGGPTPPISTNSRENFSKNPQDVISVSEKETLSDG